MPTAMQSRTSNAGCRTCLTHLEKQDHQRPPHLEHLPLHVLLLLRVAQHPLQASQAELLLAAGAIHLSRQQLYVHAAIGVCTLLLGGLQPIGGQNGPLSEPAWRSSCSSKLHQAYLRAPTQLGASLSSIYTKNGSLPGGW